MSGPTKECEGTVVEGGHVLTALGEELRRSTSTNTTDCWVSDTTTASELIIIIMR